MVGAILSNQSYAAYLPGSFQSKHYHLEAFEWTNGSTSASSNDLLSRTKVND